MGGLAFWWRLLWADRTNALYVAAVVVLDAALTWALARAPAGWGGRRWTAGQAGLFAAAVLAAALVARAAWVAAVRMAAG